MQARTAQLFEWGRCTTFSRTDFTGRRAIEAARIYRKRVAITSRYCLQILMYAAASRLWFVWIHSKIDSVLSTYLNCFHTTTAFSILQFTSLHRDTEGRGVKMSPEGNTLDRASCTVYCILKWHLENDYDDSLKALQGINESSYTRLSKKEAPSCQFIFEFKKRLHDISLYLSNFHDWKSVQE